MDDTELLYEELKNLEDCSEIDPELLEGIQALLLFLGFPTI
jgi:hypothetical protein|tara:strand:+ start:517 stop:639 length:123 start_codon:yes stop_codon:yes gene_type:complete